MRKGRRGVLCICMKERRSRNVSEMLLADPLLAVLCGYGWLQCSEEIRCASKGGMQSPREL